MARLFFLSRRFLQGRANGYLGVHLRGRPPREDGRYKR